MAALSEVRTRISRDAIAQWALDATSPRDEGLNSPARKEIMQLFQRGANILRTTQSQRDALLTYRTLWGADTATPSHVQELLHDTVIDLTQQEISNLSSAQREILALYALTIDPAQSPDLARSHKSERFKPHIQLHKFVNRLHNSRIYRTREDWLVSAGLVVEVEGVSAQDLLKEVAKQRVDAYLARIINPATSQRGIPTVYDFAAMSDIITDTVYINNNAKPLFLNHPTFYDFDMLIEKHLDNAPEFIQRHYPFSSRNKKQRGRTTEDFFAYQYPKLFYMTEHEAPTILAETFAIYMTIHPMTDGNGTMIHALIDHALQARGLRPIPGWNKAPIQKPLTELRRWIQGDTTSLEQWFTHQLLRTISI